MLSSAPVNLRRTRNLAQEQVFFEQVVRHPQRRRLLPPALDELHREFARAAEQGRQPSVFYFLPREDGLHFDNEHSEADLGKGHHLMAAQAQPPKNQNTWVT